MPAQSKYDHSIFFPSDQHRRLITQKRTKEKEKIIDNDKQN
jgi:hypothetical protein